MSGSTELEARGGVDDSRVAAVLDGVAEVLPLTPAEALPGWHKIKCALTALLRSQAPDAAWLVSLEEATARLRSFASRDFDTALYLLIQDAAAVRENYSVHHAIVCALMCEGCAKGFDWPQPEIGSLVRAALTMNLSMTGVQNALAQQTSPVTPEQRSIISAHAEQSAQMLSEVGVADTLWLDIVRLHHDERVESAGQGGLPAQKLARLLRRVDLYTAKLSARASRKAVTPAMAARDTCLGAQKRPDDMGAMILRMVGLYPPGSFVELANGDFGIVVRRGAQMHQPAVAALRRKDGGMFLKPLLRESGTAEFAVVRGIVSAVVNVEPDHLRILCAA